MGETLQTSKAKEAHAQFLQKSDKYPMIAYMCKLRRKKFSFYGASDPEIAVYNKVLCPEEIESVY